MAGPAAWGDLPSTFRRTDGLDWEGFPKVLWDTLREAGYPTPPDYQGWEYQASGVTRCRVLLRVPPHPEHPEWPSLDLQLYGHHFEDSFELATLRGLLIFYEQHPKLVEHTLIGLFPPAQADNARWMSRFLEAPRLVGQLPVEATFHLTRWLKAFHRLQSLLGSSLEAMLDAASIAAQYGHSLGARLAHRATAVESRDRQIEDLQR